MEDKITLKSFDREGVDYFELAEIVYTNGSTGSEHSFSVWFDPDEKEQITINDLENDGLDIFMSSPVVDFSRYEDYYSGVEDNQFHTHLYEAIVLDDEVLQQLVDYHNTGEDFSIEVKEGIIEKKSVIIDEELTNVLLKHDDNLLEKSDIVDLGKTLENFNVDIESRLPEEVELKFNELISDGFDNNNEKKFIKTAFDKLNIPNDISLDKENKMEQELER